MTTPPPNIFESGTQACSPDEAAASISPRSPAAAAEIQDLLEAIGCRFVLDEEAFMAAIEPPPLFLQRTA